MKKVRFLGVILAFWMMGSVLPGAAQPAAGIAIPFEWEEVRSLTVARDPSGLLWAAWEADNGTDVEIMFSHWSGKEWLSPQPARSRPQAWDRSPQLVVDASGKLWLAWSSAERTSPKQSRIYVSRWTGHSWTNPEAVPQGRVTKAKEPSLAAAPDGSLWLAWVGFDGIDDEIFAQHWDGHSWSLPQQVNKGDNAKGLYDCQPHLAVGRKGQPWLVWTGHQDGPDDEIYASRWTGTGWSPEQTVSRDDDALDVYPSVALDAQDRPWVAWQARVTDSFGEQSRLRILTSHWDAPGSTWTSEAMVSSPVAADIDEGYPTLALDSNGEMNLAWVASGAGGSALAHARLVDEGWTEPQLARAGARDDAVALTMTGDGTLALFQLSQSPGTSAPMEGTNLGNEARPLESWIGQQAGREQVASAPISNRYLAFGDSITWGQYNGFYPYPARLQDKLNAKVVPSEVINSGAAGETTNRGRDRIAEEVSANQPQFILYMEGTNDVSHLKPTSTIYENIQVTIWKARHAGVDNVEVMVATLIPRKDNLNDETQLANEEGVIPAAHARNAPVCDQWRAFYDYGPWQQLYWDDKHPNAEGLQLLADTFYGCVLATYTWLKEDITPPTTWIDPLSPNSECGKVMVSWNGSDSVSWVVSYDVQAQVNGGAWTDWLLATTALNGTYTGGFYNDTVAFRVRGRDVVGNLSDYSAPAYTSITIDNEPPYNVYMNSLPAVQIAPINLSWGGADACGKVVAYRVEYRAGTSGPWYSCNVPPTNTSGSCTPSSPQYGQTYYFRASAQDEAGNLGWSDPAKVYTLLARYSVTGHVRDARHQPITGATVTLSPASLWTGRQPGGGFMAYVTAGGNYTISAARDDLFGPLLPMVDVTVNGNVSSLEFILPPKDNVVTNGSFEAADLAPWQPGGTATPTLTTTAHTGHRAVRVGQVGGNSSLSQVVTPGSGVSNPTLSFMVRLETAGPASTLQIYAEPVASDGALSPSAVYNLPVTSDAWTHMWVDLTGLGSGPLTLTLAVSNSPAVIVDEVSLGSALNGVHLLYLPLIHRAW